MSKRADERIWERVRNNQHTAVVGFTPDGAPPPLNIMRISCDVPPSTIGPIAEAQRKIAMVLDHQAAFMEQARDFLVTGLRRRLLGDTPPAGPAAELVSMANRLAKHDQPYALVFDAVDAADEATCRTLRRVLERTGWMTLPVVLVLRGRNVDRMNPAPRQLLDAVRKAYGEHAIITAEGTTEGTTEGVEATGEEATVPDWWELPDDVIEVLRAGAVVGSGFEAELVALLLERSPLEVLLCLQRAVDMGVPIEDRGEDRFFVPLPLLAELRESLLPSLQAALHRRLAMIMSAAEEAAPARTAPETAAPQREPAPVPRPAEERRAQAPGFFVEVFGGEEEKARAAEAAEAEEAEEEGFPAWPGGVAQEPGVRPGPGPLPASGPEAEPRPEPGMAPPTEAQSRPYRDEARAASHLDAAGQLEAAAQRYAAAAGQAAAMGAFEQAMVHGRRALALIGKLPASPTRRQFRIGMMAELGRLQWQAAGSHGGQADSAFTLKSALATADATLEALRDDDPPELLAEVRELVAGICYDLGDPDSLERALEELTRATRMLIDAGEATRAARLLNDQAAIYVRLGDPVRASHLLTQSQKIFESKADNDPVALEELAETHHLFARLPLHARIRPGRESDAFSMGLEEASIAEKNYRKLGDVRELARVWETMGRLELARGELEQAAKKLSSALQIQTQAGDLTGLARSTAALSEVLAARGKFADALAVLGDSVLLNHEKGSPIGLAFNRRALEQLMGRIKGELDRDPRLGRALSELDERLRAAESMLGRVPLPDESPPPMPG